MYKILIVGLSLVSCSIQSGVVCINAKKAYKGNDATRPRIIIGKTSKCSSVFNDSVSWGAQLFTKTCEEQRHMHYYNRYTYNTIALALLRVKSIPEDRAI